MNFLRSVDQFYHMVRPIIHQSLEQKHLESAKCWFCLNFSKHSSLILISIYGLMCFKYFLYCIGFNKFEELNVRFILVITEYAYTGFVSMVLNGIYPSFEECWVTEWQRLQFTSW